MNIEYLINEDLIILDLRAKDKDSAIVELASKMERAEKLYSLPAYIQSVHDREAMTTTSVGFGVAIPHARSSAVRDPAVAFGRSTGISWDNDTDELIRLVFLLAIPESKPNTEYMELLATIARMLVHEDFRKTLMNVSSAQEVLMALPGTEKT